MGRRVSRCWLYITLVRALRGPVISISCWRARARVCCASRRENHRRPYKLPSRVLTKCAPRAPAHNEKRRPINIARMAPRDRRCARWRARTFSPTRTDCGPRGNVLNADKNWSICRSSLFIYQSNNWFARAHTHTHAHAFVINITAKCYVKKPFSFTIIVSQNFVLWLHFRSLTRYLYEIIHFQSWFECGTIPRFVNFRLCVFWLLYIYIFDTLLRLTRKTSGFG